MGIHQKCLREATCHGYSFEGNMLWILIRSASEATCCGYSLEVPQRTNMWVLIRSASERQHIMVHSRSVSERQHMMGIH